MQYYLPDILPGPILLLFQRFMFPKQRHLQTVWFNGVAQCPDILLLQDIINLSNFTNFASNCML